MALDPLATTIDLQERLGRTLETSERARAAALLADASASVRSYTGQQFTQDETTDRLAVKNGGVRLPQRPVTSVTAVADPDAVDVSYTWDHGDVVRLDAGVPDTWAWEPRRTTLTWVDVTYEHGYEEIPADIVAVVCQIAGRALGASAEHSGVTQVSVGDASQSFGSTGAAGALGLLADERSVLDRYRRVGGSALLAR